MKNDYRRTALNGTACGCTLTNTVKLIQYAMEAKAAGGRGASYALSFAPAAANGGFGGSGFFRSRALSRR